jgi:hypothetical protein
LLLRLIETSSKNNVNVTEAFVELARQMRAQNPNRASAAALAEGGETQTTPARGGGCCAVA